MFNHVELDLPEISLRSETLKSGTRYYYDENGNKYPSITTVISHFSKKSIMEWRKRVGEKEANRITTQAARRGTSVHQLCEDYINNIEIDYSKLMPNDTEMFLTLKETLDTRLDDVYVQEWPMYSEHLGIAGKCDCIAYFDGKLSIIDFKTSRKSMHPNKLENYFRQASGYAVMFEERTKIPINNLVIIAAIDDQKDAEVYTSKRDSHINGLIEMITEYKAQL
jgi:genome maintenance exonuclease 1